MDLLYLIPTMFTFSALYAAVSLLCSALCRRNLTAITLSYILMAFGLILPVLLSGLTELFPDEIRNQSYSQYRVIKTVTPLLSPYFYYFPRGLGNRFHHHYADWNEWGTVALHSILVLGLAAALVGLATLVLWRTRRKD